MALLDKFTRLADQRQELFAGGLEPADVVVESVLSPTRAIVGGRETILFGTNNYLGLTFEPACIKADPPGAEGSDRHHRAQGQRAACGSDTC